jgi:hypothetical protein
MCNECLPASAFAGHEYARIRTGHVIAFAMWFLAAEALDERTGQHGTAPDRVW